MAIVLTLLLATAQDPPAPAPEPRPLEVIDGAAEAPLTAAPVAAAAARPEVEAALRAGDYEKAEALLAREAEAQPSSEVLRLLGIVFLRGGRPLNAAIALKKAEALAPLDEPSRFTLSMAYVAMGKRAWARPELQKLAAQAPTKALYPYWLARLDYDDNQYATAVKGLEKAIALEPGFARAHDNLGLCYEALGRFDEARKAWEQAIRLNEEQNSRSPWPALNLGLLLTRLDRADEAEVRFRESLRADPRFAPAHYQLGVVLEKKGKTDEARSELEDAARLDPASAETQYALARLYRRTGEAEKADTALKRFEELKKQKSPNANQAGPG
jgi:tetratricopeptide (TPR) repeat protein